MGDASKTNVPRGFAGISLLLTQLNDEPVVVPQAPSVPAPTAREIPPTADPPMAMPPTPKPSTSHPPTPKKTAAAPPRKKSPSVWGNTIVWFVVVAALSGAYLQSDGAKKQSAQSPDLPSQTVVAAPQPKPANEAAANLRQQPNLTFGKSMVDPQIAGLDRPAMGTGNVLSIGEIRYCLAEAIRIDAGSTVLDGADNHQIDRFNSFVDDYNGRCGNYRYLPSAMTKARSDIAQITTDLQAEGRNRIKL